MRNFCLIVLLCLGGSLPARAGSVAIPGWTIWKTGQLASIWLEQSLYRDDQGSFYVHVQVRNETEGELGVDLRRPYRLVYPNQWTCDDKPLQRKISAGNRSEWGAALQARIMSVFSTAAQRGVNFIDLLVRALAEPQLTHL